MPQIEVTFDIDANGILKVTASDKATSRSQHITITASSGLSESEIDRMKKEAESHAEEDVRRKELIEARNYCDNTIYAAEKTLRDYGDKVPADVKKAIDEKITAAREKMKDSEDTAAIRKAAEELGQVLQKVGEAMYQQPGATGPGAAGPGGPGGPGAGPSAGPTSGPSGSGPSGEDVVDGEFRSA